MLVLFANQTARKKVSSYLEIDLHWAMTHETKNFLTPPYLSLLKLLMIY
jgi:hypothetical protein